MKKSIKIVNIIQLTLSLLLIILVNIISNYVFTRIDLTSDKRYTLSPSTKKILKSLNETVFFKVYLEGDFPAGFKRLHNETKEMLDQMRVYSNNIQYEFVNPLKDKNKKINNDNYKLLIEKGLDPTNLQVKTKDGSSQQIIFPGAIVSYKEKETALQLLNSQIGVPAEDVLNNSIQSLEYNIINVINKLTSEKKNKIAFIQGHKELGKYYIADIFNTLLEYYEVDVVKINGKLNSLRVTVDSIKGQVENKYKAIIIANPDSLFNEKDKFIIDQYIMNGGKALWFIDAVFASQDSLQKSSVTLGISKQINLEDMFFMYGVRINNNLILDLNALPIPIKTGDIGGRPQFGFKPWFYFPILTPVIKHPIVNNLNSIKTEFVSSIDTIEHSGIKKTILLNSSKYSRTFNAPVRISLETLLKQPIEDQYNKQNLPIAVLLEGKFNSLYKNRIPTEIANNKGIVFKDKSISTAMIIVSDGDLIKNQVREVNGKFMPYPLGYDRYTRETFGNKDFILNAINYLCDDSDLLQIRGREVKLRLLDKTKAENNKLMIQLINIILPVFLILLFGFIFNIIRKMKYSKTLIHQK